MQTPVIQNLVNVAAAKSSATPADNSGSGVSFQHMLSQQVAERQPSKPAENTKAPEQQAAKPADNGAPVDSQPPKAENTKDAAGDTTADASGQTGKSTAAEDDKKVMADAADPAIPLTATELIAQALNIPQRADAKTDTKNDPKSDTKAVVDTRKPVDALVAAGQTPLARGRMLAANEANTKSGIGDKATIGDKTNALTERTGKPAADTTKTSDFGAAMKQAGEQKAAPAAAAAAEAQSQAKAAAVQAAEDHAAPTAALTTAPAQLHQAGIDMVQAASGQAERLTPRVGTPAWDQALGQKVVWMVGGAQQSASLTLNPPDLGPLQVVLNVNNGQADASFYAAQPEVRQALEAALPKLRDMMSDAGVQLGQTSVSAGMPDQFNQAERQQSQQGGRHGNQAQDTAEAAPTIRTQAITSGNGLVDTFV